MSALPEAPRLGLGAKINYGLGSVAQAVAGVALSSSIIAFYLNQVVGLAPALVGTVIFASLAIDAVLDPAIGRWSDNFRSRWGRRHPFMYASALPIALAIYFLWHPPLGLPSGALAAFMLAMLITLRLCVSLYDIPSSALAPELAPDYHERTSLLSFRFFFGICGGALMAALLLGVFLRKDATHPLGMLNRAGYGQFGLLAAIVVFVSILISSASTHRYIPLLRPAPTRRLSFGQSMKEIVSTLGNRSLVVIMLSGLISGVVTGMNATLNNYMWLHFWRLSPQMVGLMLVLAAPASVVGVVVAPILSKALDKKRTMITVFLLSIFTGVIPVSLRLLGLMPPNGSPWIPAILIADGFVAGTLGLIGFVIISSMIADVVEDAAVKTGVRSEGLLFSANSLLPKFTTGIGAFVGGIMLTVVHFPKAALPGTVDPEVLRHLVFLSLPVATILSLASTLVLVFYRIDRSIHEANLQQLAAAPTAAE